MKKLSLVLLLTILSPAMAAEEPKKFAPFVIDEAAYKAILSYLIEVPWKYSNPLITDLGAREDAALKKVEDEQRKPPDDQQPRQ